VLQSLYLIHSLRQTLIILHFQFAIPHHSISSSHQAFEAYDQSNAKAQSVNCIKYMILCKVLNEAAAEVPAILTSKIGMYVMTLFLCFVFLLCDIR